MDKKIIIGSILTVLVVIGLFYFNSNRQQTNQEPSTQQLQSENSASTITIRNFSFTPETLTVKEGTKVIWVNQDTAPHIITSETFSSSTINQGNTFEFTFATKGTFEYSCSIHPSMKGKIVVE